MTTNTIQPQPKKVTKFTDKLNSELTNNYLSKLYDRLDEVKNHLHRNRLANHLSFLTNAK